jgi:hypothetical protein
MRDDRRLNALARGQLRARRGAEPRLSPDGNNRAPREAPMRAATASDAVPALVAILPAVLR